MAKYIDYEMTGELLYFVDDEGGTRQVQKGSEEAADLFEEVAKNRDLAGLNGEEAKAARIENLKAQEDESQGRNDAGQADAGTATGVPEAKVGDACKTDDGRDGTLQPFDGGTLVCVANKSHEEIDAEAKAAQVGTECDLPDDSKGNLQYDPEGSSAPLVCLPKFENVEVGTIYQIADGRRFQVQDVEGSKVWAPSTEQQPKAGDPCTTEDGKKGLLQEVDGQLVCVVASQDESAGE